MKTPIAILSVVALVMPLVSAEEGERGRPDGKRPNPRQHFDRMDADSSGTVSLEEFKSTPRAKEHPEKAEEIFKRIDADSSGDITFQEMVQHHQKMRARHRDCRRSEGEGGGEGKGDDGGGKTGPAID